MTVPASEPLDEPPRDRAGWRAELRDVESRVLYRTLLTDPLEREYPTDEGMAQAPRAVAADFWVAVPDLASAHDLVLFGSLHATPAPTQKLATFDLQSGGR